LYAVLFGFFGLPLVVLITSALTPNATTQFVVPTHPSLSNFGSVAGPGSGFGTALLNGFILAGGSSLIALLMGLMAAYPLSRFRFRGRVGYLLAVLFITGLPVTALIVPIFEFYLDFNWINSTIPVMLLMAAFGTPISVWLMKTFVDGVDVGLEESAWIDGANRVQAYIRVVLPVIGNALLVVFLMNFIFGWGNFYLPFILLSSTSKLPLSVTIFQFFGSYGAAEFGKLSAFSILYSLPAVIMYVFTGGRAGGAFMSGAFK
jgi:multiple sugar transport system permease protein